VGVEAGAGLHFAAEQGFAWVLPFADRVGEAGNEFVEAVHEAGLLVGTWIVDEPERARALLRAGVDAVATNEPRAICAACRDLLPS
jgi:glycerophosphoryl diester phosphodiesterase